MNNSSMLTTTFCRKCRKLKSCLETNSVSNYRYLCKECAKNEDLISQCISCGREGITTELMDHGGYCHLCEDNNIVECNLCGAETFRSDTDGYTCYNCLNGKNKACIRCGDYYPVDKLTVDDLCFKCALVIHTRLCNSGVNEVVECISCGREAHVNNLDKGLCIYCKCDSLEDEIKRLKRRKKAYH